QCRAFLQHGRIPCSPDSSSTPHPSKLKAQAAEMLPMGESDEAAFLLIDSHLEGCQLLPEAFVHSLKEPIVLRLGLHQDHEISREPGLVEGGRGTTAGDLFRLLQHPLHRGEIQMTEERREYTPYKVANPLLEFSTSIPRTQLRPSYGEGFLGAPLQLGTRRDPPMPLGQGDDRGPSRTSSPSTSGDSEHV